MAYLIDFRAGGGERGRMIVTESNDHVTLLGFILTLNHEVADLSFCVAARVIAYHLKPIPDFWPEVVAPLIENADAHRAFFDIELDAKP